MIIIYLFQKKFFFGVNFNFPESASKNLRIFFRQIFYSQRPFSAIWNSVKRKSGKMSHLKKNPIEKDSLVLCSQFSYLKRHSDPNRLTTPLSSTPQTKSFGSEAVRHVTHSFAATRFMTNKLNRIATGGKKNH